MEIGGLVLAAGAGRRYGMPKALIERDGRRFVQRAADTLGAAGCAPVIVVVGAAADEVRAVAPGLTFVDNPEWSSGMASSLRAGLGAMARTTAGAALVLLVDMPGVTVQAVQRVMALGAPDALAMGGYAGRRGHPVLLGREHWAGVAETATGDRGARDYLRDHPVQVVEVGDVADDFDVDVADA